MEEAGFRRRRTLRHGGGPLCEPRDGRSAEAVTRESLLVEPELAEAQASEGELVGTVEDSGISTAYDHAALETRSPRVSASVTESPKPTKGPDEFYGTVSFSSEQVGHELSRLHQEVLRHLAVPGIESTITVEIRASAAQGFDEDTVELISENAHVLRFDDFRFRER